MIYLKNLLFNLFFIINYGKLSFINIPKFEILIFLEYEFSDVDMKTI